MNNIIIEFVKKKNFRKVGSAFYIFAGMSQANPAFCFSECFTSILTKVKRDFFFYVYGAY